MTLHGKPLIAGLLAQWAANNLSAPPLRAVNPATGQPLEPAFIEADEAQVSAAVDAAAAAFAEYRRRTPAERTAFLDAIGRHIEALGDELLDRASAETGLGADRLRGERGRTVAQLRMFARLIEEGSWVDARIDTADPARKPAPKPDLRRILVPIGPVAVFGASNLPLAFSVAGGDTASALAAGCPVVVKAHPGHPGTSEMVAGAIAAAAAETRLPAGVFSMIHGRAPAVGLALVRHPRIKAVGFTGSLRAGRALFDAAAARPEPIPVYAEMGSINPVFVLPGALAERGALIATGLKASVTLGVGQFCTNPGLIVGLDDGDGKFAAFKAEAGRLIAEGPPGVMLYPALRDEFVAEAGRFEAIPGVSRTGGPPKGDGPAQARPTAFSVDADTFLSQPELSQEMFGPSTLLVTARSREQVLAIAGNLAGHLTATIQGNADDLQQWRDLIDLLREKVGRLIFNGFPTGVEVSPAMQHGGPYPATTDCRTTSVGTAAIERFVRPICFQNFPKAVLPPELHDKNPRGIWRLVNGERTRGEV